MKNKILVLKKKISQKPGPTTTITFEALRTQRAPLDVSLSIEF